MNVIPGAAEWLKEHHYRVEKTGPVEWSVIDEEAEDPTRCVVCKAPSHAEATRELIRLRFTD